VRPHRRARDDPQEGLRPVEGQPDPGHARDVHRDAHWAAAQGATIEVTGFGVTGYAGDVLEKSLGADANIVETVAHMMSAKRWFPNVDVICDIGGQDIKVLFMQNGDVKNFRL
jgi:activator of 2-hydroxyglutaryl-CoA dehydratase